MTGSDSRGRRYRAMAPLLALAAALSTQPCSANDRPYLVTTSAAAEEDDDGVWSVESWAQRIGSLRTFSIASEYAFDPTTSLQLEFTRVRDKDQREAGLLADIELKHLFNHIARDGYGWGIAASLGFAKPADAGWRRVEWSVKLPFTVALWEGEGQAHLNAGTIGLRGGAREWLASVAVEREVWKRTTLFGELAHAGEAGLAHAGVRYWAKREKFAIDVSAQRVRVGGRAESGVVIGLGWYDF